MSVAMKAETCLHIIYKLKARNKRVQEMDRWMKSKSTKQRTCVMRQTRLDIQTETLLIHKEIADNITLVLRDVI